MEISIKATNKEKLESHIEFNYYGGESYVLDQDKNLRVKIDHDWHIVGKYAAINTTSFELSTCILGKQILVVVDYANLFFHAYTWTFNQGFTCSTKVKYIP